MDGSLALASDSRAFTRTDDDRDSFSDAIDRFLRHALPQQARFVHGVTAPSTSNVFQPSSFESEFPAWLQHTADPVDATLARQREQALGHRTVIACLQTRLGELKQHGTEERLPWSLLSERDLKAFLFSQPRIREPGIVLMDNGNLRAIWRNRAGEQVALEFRGYGRVHFVFFARRPQPALMARSAGEDQSTQIGHKIVADQLSELVFG